ncbi:MAG: type II secretion system protein [Phycisphaerales bacterium JB038]
MNRASQRGFTLSQVFVLLILAVVVAVLLTPMWAHKRRISSLPQSMRNLKSLAQFLAVHANENRDALFNPFEATNAVADTWRVNPTENDLEAAHAPADSFSYFAASELCRWADLTAKEGDYCVSPRDAHTRERFKHRGKEVRLTPSSYWYSATMYYSPARFAWPDSGSTAEGARWGYVQCNTFDDIRFPSQKVTLVQKQDFGSSGRLLFSAPNAQVPLVLADGSGMFSHNRKLIAAVQQDPSLAPSGGNWADPSLADYGMDSKEEGLADQEGLYPAFYHWTRDGIHGRDLF